MRGQKRTKTTSERRPVRWDRQEVPRVEDYTEPKKASAASISLAVIFISIFTMIFIEVPLLYIILGPSIAGAFIYVHLYSGLEPEEMIDEMFKYNKPR